MRSSNVAASATNEASFLLSREYQPKPETSRTRRCSARTCDTPSVATSFARSSTAWLWPRSSIATRIRANIASHAAFVSLCQGLASGQSSRGAAGVRPAEAVWIALRFSARRSYASRLTLPPHRVHAGAAGQLDRRAVVGVTVAQVDPARAQVAGLEVNGRARAVVEHLVVGAQQRGAGAQALPVRPNGQEGQVVVRGTAGVVLVEGGVEGQEPADPPAGGGAEPCVVADGRARP